MDKFLVICCAFSFISGAYAVVLLNKMQEVIDVKQAVTEVHSCAVSIKQGKETHIWVGEYK